MESRHKTFRRADGVVGVGYALMFAGVQQMSVAWPDCEAKRYIANDLGRHGVEEVIPVDQLEKWRPDEDDQVEPLTISELEKLTSDPAPEIGPTGQGSDADQTGIGQGSDSQSDAQTSEATEQTNGPTDQTSEAPPISEAQHIRNYLAEHGSGTANKVVVAALKAQGVNVTGSQVARAKAELAPQAESTVE